ncbi:MAG: hypothetical protein AB7E51_08510 [Pseudodesulfovibrio sp.]|uniref:hypothetical protein n=1 Tax=Pseudodesulfovibrio sp. TaxID=2035812 RepID=UPI003D128420
MRKIKYYRNYAKTNQEITIQLFVSYLERICHTESLLLNVSKFYASFIAIVTIGGWALLLFKLNGISGFHIEGLINDAIRNGLLFIFGFDTIVSICWVTTSYGLTVRHTQQVEVAKKISKSLPYNPIGIEVELFKNNNKFAGHHMSFVLPFAVFALMISLTVFTSLYGIAMELLKITK